MSDNDFSHLNERLAWLGAVAEATLNSGDEKVSYAIMVFDNDDPEGRVSTVANQFPHQVMRAMRRYCRRTEREPKGKH